MEERFEPLGIGVGTLIAGRYDIARKLGSGSMSAVFEAVDRSLGSELIALKLFEPRLSEEEEFIARLKEEVLITRKLTHPNIVRTFDWGQAQTGHYFMTMERVRGGSLYDLMKATNGKIDFSLAVRIIYEIAVGMQYAHEMGVVHRDLKPANVLIGEHSEIKIADFGLARSSELSRRLTRTGECVGTPYYMAPEQVMEKETDHRMDIYALGVIAHELVTGVVPFENQSWYDLAQQIIKEPIKEFATKKNGIPLWFQEFVMKAAAKLPEDRFSSCEEIAVILEPHLTAESNKRIGMGTTQSRRLHSRVSTLAPAVASNTGLSVNWLKLAPSLLVVCLLVVVVILVGSASQEASKKVNNRVEQSVQVMDRFATSLSKIQQVVTSAVENQDKIDAYLKKEEERKKELEKLAVPVSPVE